MGRFYKATTLDGATHDDKAQWEVGKTCVIEESSRRSGLWDYSGVFRARDVAGETLGVESWPCRLFAVEGEPFASDGHHTYGFWELSVVEELPAWQALGPNGERVAALLERCRRITTDTVKAIDAVWDEEVAEATKVARNQADRASWYAARHGAWSTAEDAIQSASWYKTWRESSIPSRIAAVDVVMHVCENGALAVVTWDLATEDGPYTIEMRDLLYKPLEEAIGKV